MSHNYGRVAAAILGVTLAMAGCSGGGANDAAQPQGEVTVSTPADETPAPTTSSDFDTAVKSPSWPTRATTRRRASSSSPSPQQLGTSPTRR
jgi:hypothetical protein